MIDVVTYKTYLKDMPTLLIVSCFVSLRCSFSVLVSFTHIDKRRYEVEGDKESGDKTDLVKMVL